MVVVRCRYYLLWNLILLKYQGVVLTPPKQEKDKPMQRQCFYYVVMSANLVQWSRAILSIFLSINGLLTRSFFAGMASSMGQSMASYYNPTAAYGSLNAASMAAAMSAQQSAAMSAGLTGPSQVSFLHGQHS